MALTYKPHNYQIESVEHIIHNERSALFLDMGMGKTVSTLTAIVELQDRMETSKVLIIAPKLVAEQTWPDEALKWAHTKHLRISPIVGSPKQRLRAIAKDADIYTIGRDNVRWLVEQLGRGGWKFDTLVIDELSSFKSADSQRFKALRKVAFLSYRCVGLTGTPAPNSLMDLWSQIYLLDQGERLGRTLTQYRQAYFIKNFSGFGYTLNSKHEQTIHDNLKDICISMTAKDYLDLPERLDSVKTFSLTSYNQYEEFKESSILQLGDEAEITPMNAAGLYNKLLQFSNGAVYDEDKKYHIVDNTKLDLLEDMVESLQGKPLLVFYSFRSDVERIQKRMPFVTVMDGKQTIDDWNAGKIRVLLAHPASIGHGLNMQYGGHHMAWFGLPWSLELYLQAIKRLDRQGQKNMVVNAPLIGKGTIEELVWSRLGEKEATQDKLIDALKKHLFG